MGHTEFVHTTGWPVYRHQGNLYTFDLWRRDLELHFDYIRHMTLASPIIDAPPPKEASQIRPDIADRIRLVHVPSVLNGWIRLRNTPSYFVRLVLALRHAEAFQCILVEYPILFGFLLPLLRRFTSIRLITFVESSSWRRPRASPLIRLYSRFCEFMSRRAVQACHVSLHTQAEYKSSLADNSPSAFVIPAVWIDESDIITAEALAERLRQRSPDGVLRVGYFGWIIPDKGLDVLIRAATLCVERGLDVHVDVVGDGPMRPECEALAAPLGERVRFLGVLPYGPVFFAKLAECDAAAIPNRMTEHVRITVDAMSQGLPVVGSDVPGLRQFIEEGVNGLLVPAGDAPALAEALARLVPRAEIRQRMAENSRTKVLGLSHRKMHLARATALRQVLGSLTELEPA